MKKLVLAAALITFAVTSVFAYNPPFGGEEMYRLSGPEMLSGTASSASGGPLMTVVPSSIVFNPALTAFEQRADVDLSTTLLFNTDPIDEDEIDDADFGCAFQIGSIIPTKWGVFTGSVDGIFADFAKMNLKKIVSVHGGASKEINEKLGVGANIYTGFYFGDKSDFSVGLDLGVLYKMGRDLGFLKAPRIGVSLLNCGKPASDYENYGISIEDDSESYPGILTPRVSFAADLFEFKEIKGAFSSDMSFPTFQNMLFDVAFGMTYKNLAYLNVGWQMNLREVIEGEADGLCMPTIGLGCKIIINSKRLSAKNADWERSELNPSVAWQNLYNGIHAISLGTRIDLGMADTTAPEIILWEEK